MQAIRVRDIHEGGYEALGVEVLPQHSGGHAEAVAEWTRWAEERYGAEVAPRELSIPAKPPLLNFVEAHPNSPQLTVSFREPWILSLVPGWTASFLRSVDRAVVHRPAGNRGADPGRALARQRDPARGDRHPGGVPRHVRDEWTELPNPVPLLLDQATV